MKKTDIKKFALLLNILIFPAIFAEEQHIIENFDINIDGTTKERALRKEMNLKEGQVFITYEDLVAAVSDQEQDLINTRVFNPGGVQMHPRKIRTEEETNYYTVDIFLEDTWTILPIPYPKYETGVGFRVGLKLFYDNALGSMNNFYLGMNLDLQWDEEEESFTPGSWTFNPQLNDVKIGDKEYNFGLMFRYAETQKTEADGTVIEEHNYYNSDFSISTKYDLGHDYFYRINPSIGFNYGDSGFNYEKEPYYLKFSHSGGYSAVDWKKNFREGFSLTAGNSVAYVFRPDSEDSNGMKFTIDAEERYYKILHKRLNYTNRLYGVFSFQDELSGMDEYLRGPTNSSMYGISGVFMSHDLTVGVIQWEGVGEAQFQPFFDMGLTKREGEAFDREQDFRYGTGADFILYLDKLNSLHARGTLAVDLSNDLAFTDFDKYEIIITSSLSY